jgi:hypothetical protein
MDAGAKGIKTKRAERRAHSTTEVYFSCPKFTVSLTLNGTVIAKAAPLVRVFEGQSIGALISWVLSKFGGPITIEKLY